MKRATEKEFWESVVRRGLLTQEKLDECREVALLMSQMGEVKSLEEVVLEKKYLTSEQIEEFRRTSEPEPRPPAEEPKRPAKGVETVAGYALESVLGHGRFGSVYRGSDGRRTAALKIVKTPLLRVPEDADRFLAESRRAMEVRHPNLIEVYDCGREEKRLHVASEFVDGMTLRDTVLTTGPLGEKRALQMAADLARALGALHEKKLIHRNLTPGNVLIARDGAVKLADFGLTPSVEVDREINERGVAYGAVGWMSPEQIVGLEDLDGRADLYGLGAVLYFALTGKPLFVGAGERQTIQSQLREIPPSPQSYVPTLGSSTAAIVMKLLDRDRARRFGSAAEALRDIDAVLDPKAALAQAREEGRRKSNLFAAAGVGAALAAFSVFAYLYLREGEPVVPPGPGPIVQQPTPAPTPAPTPTPTPPPPTGVEASAQQLFEEAEKQFGAGRWDEARKLYTELRLAFRETGFVSRRNEEIEQKVDACNAKLNEAADAQRAAAEKAARIAESFKETQKLMDAGQWDQAQSALAAIAGEVKGDPVAFQTMQVLKERCDLEAQAVAAWKKVQSAVQERRWSDVAAAAQEFKSKFENTQTFKSAAVDLEVARTKSAREDLAAAAIRAVREKFQALQFDDAMKEYADLQAQHGDTDAYKAAEAELKTLAEGVNLKRKEEREAQAKKALEEAEKLFAEKKYIEADAAFEKLLEEFKESDAVRAAEKQIAERRDAITKKLEGERDSLARKDYTKIRSMLEKKNYEEGIPLLKGYLEKYGETEFVKGRKKEVDDYLDKGEWALKKLKRLLIDDFESGPSAWEPKGNGDDKTRAEESKIARIGDRSMSVQIPAHKEEAKDGNWPRVQKPISDGFDEDIAGFSFWARAEKSMKVTFQVHQGEDENESVFVVEKQVGTDWTLVKISMGDFKWVWSGRKRASPPRLDPTRVTWVGFGVIGQTKAVEFLVDQLKVEEPPR
jgi:hypothetical protein